MLAALYLIFNEGYLASTADALVRRELCDEAIRLTRVLAELMPGEAEVAGLLALMLLHHSRRDARSTPHGALVLLEDQDRSRWHRDGIEEGSRLPARAGAGGATRSRPRSPPSTPARTAATPTGRGSPPLRPARQLTAPVVELNRAVAIALSEGPGRDWPRSTPSRTGGARALPPAHSARGDLLRRAGRDAAAAERSRARSR